MAYASRTLSKAEQKYCVTRKELLAVVTFLKHFRPYLLGHHFTLRTDHSSLQWIYSMKEPEGQLAWWLEQIQEFDFEVVHRRGSCHQNADALSRLHNLGESEFPGKVLEYPAQLCSCAVQDIGPVLQSVISGKSPGGQFL